MIGQKSLKYCAECRRKDPKTTDITRKIRCIKCKKLKSYTEYHIDQHHNTRRQRICKDPCRKEYNKKYYKDYVAPKKYKKATAATVMTQLHQKLKEELGL